MSVVNRKVVLWVSLVAVITIAFVFINPFETTLEITDIKEPVPEVETETIEEKAYRVETRPRPAPEAYDETSRSIWELEEQLRIAQAKIRIESQKNSEVFRRKWMEYRKTNSSAYRKLSILKGKQRDEGVARQIESLFGKESSEYKDYLNLEKQKQQKEISMKDYHNKLNVLRRSKK